MMELKQRYLSAGGSELDAAVRMARDLMRGDAATFKAGYTKENAALAVADVFGVDAADVLDVLKGER